LVVPIAGHKPSLRLFVMQIAWGHKFAQLVAGGSVYILILVACLDLLWSISRALGRVPFEVGKMLRRPDDSSAGRLIQSRIIPTIAYMRRKLPLCLNNLSWSSLAVSHGLSATVDCTSLKDSDRFFDCLERKWVLTDEIAFID
jgi:hypothetical protein